MGDYNELLEQFNSLSNAYSNLRTNSAVEEKKAKTRFETCKYIIIILAFAALYFGTSSIGKVPKPDYAFSTEEYTQRIQSTREKAYADGRASAIEEHSGDYDEGYEAGYERASADLENDYLSSLERAYDEAYDEGYETGYEDGKAEAPAVTSAGGYSEDEIYRKAYAYAEDQLRHEYEEIVADAYDNGYDNGYSDGEDSVGR